VCEDCGCTVTPTRARDSSAVEILGSLLDDRGAKHNRDHFNSHRVVAFDLMTSPGAGKTALLETTIEAITSSLRIAVIEGDLETDNDARRIRARGVPAIQITTGSACHLDARMIHDALHDLPWSKLDIVSIENVGNLVCPTSFDLGQHRNVVLLSVTEGGNKLSKIAESHIRALANPAPMMQTSVRQRETLAPWLTWLKMQLAAVRSEEAA
jgi:hydrogenase nickel incorporation protein HypB